MTGDSLERYFISLLLQSRDACDLAKGKVLPEDMPDPFHENILASLFLMDGGDPWEFKYTAEKMGLERNSGEYQTLEGLYSEAFSGGFNFEATGSIQIVEDTVMRIAERGKKRFAAKACAALAQKCLQPDVDLAMIAADLSIIETRITETVDRKTWRQLVSEWFQKFQDKFEHQGVRSQLGTGMPTIDGLIREFKAGELVVISAKRKVGKSAFMVGIVNKSTVIKKAPCLIMTLEMGIDEWFDRLVAFRTGIDSERIYHGNVRDDDVLRVGQELAEIQNSPIMILDSNCFTMGEIESLIKLHKRKRDIEYAIIDHAQLIKYTSGKKNDNKTTEMDDMGASLKRLAKKLGITLFLLSQTNDKGVTYNSSMLEAHLNKLIRLEIPSNDPDGEHSRNRYVNLLLNRSGKTGGVEAIFDGATCRFSEIVIREEPNVTRFPSQSSDP